MTDSPEILAARRLSKHLVCVDNQHRIAYGLGTCLYAG